MTNGEAQKKNELERRRNGASNMVAKIIPGGESVDTAKKVMRGQATPGQLATAGVKAGAKSAAWWVAGSAWSFLISILLPFSAMIVVLLIIFLIISGLYGETCETIEDWVGRWTAEQICS